MSNEDLLAHQQAVIEAHARYAMWRRAKAEHDKSAEVIENELASARAELDNLAMRGMAL